MLDLLERFLERKAVRQRVVLPSSADVLQTAADILAAERDLGYRPKVQVVNGLNHAQISKHLESVMEQQTSCNSSVLWQQHLWPRYQKL